MQIHNKKINSNIKQTKPSFKGFGNFTYKVQSNTVANRAIIQTVGGELPWVLTANSKAEKKERSLRSVLYLSFSFISPVILLPIINKKVLKTAQIAKTKNEAKIIQVSKEYLNDTAEKMVEGIKKTGEKLGASKEFDGILNKFKSKEEELREKLIKAHKNVFKWDFITSSALVSSVPWIGNYYTRKRTGRIGYSGEFEMAQKNYTDKTASKHENTRKWKIPLSYGLAVLPAFIFPKVIGNALLKDTKNLGKISNAIKQKAKNYDYKDGIFMSRSIYAMITLFGDIPTFLLACRDKHELKNKIPLYALWAGIVFGGDLLLNSIAGKASDKLLKTQVMNREGYENANALKKLFMPIKSMKEVAEIKNLSPRLLKRTKRAAAGIYWGNLALTAIGLYVGQKALVNVMLAKDVKKGIEKEKALQNGQDFYKNLRLNFKPNELFKEFTNSPS